MKKLSPKSNQYSTEVNIVTICVALLLSSVSAYFSITGMGILFSGAAFAVMLMAATLELAKVMATVWLHYNWDTAPKVIKGYLLTSVVVLIFITSMGTFGYLSRAHIEQTSNSSDYTLQIDNLQSSLDNETTILNQAKSRLDSLNDLVKKASDKDVNYINSRQRSERAQLDSTIKSSIAKIELINKDLLPLQRTQNIAQSDIGPLKYVAEMIYGPEEAEKHFDQAVRFIIMFIVLVFDPLAIVLLLAGNFGLTMSKEKEPEVKKTKRVGKVREIPENNIMNFVKD